MELWSKNYSLWPDRAALRELLRPWKLASFLVAMALLLYGALNFGIGDWDVGVTLIMGALTYVLAPWSVLVIGSALRYRPRWWWAHVLLAVVVAVLVVDTSYTIYHSLAGNRQDREGNFLASFPLFFLAGMCWLYRGSLRELARELRQALSARNR
jgi:hypothetical protein